MNGCAQILSFQSYVGMGRIGISTYKYKIQILLFQDNQTGPKNRKMLLHRHPPSLKSVFKGVIEVTFLNLKPPSRLYEFLVQIKVMGLLIWLFLKVFEKYFSQPKHRSCTFMVKIRITQSYVINSDKMARYKLYLLNAFIVRAYCFNSLNRSNLEMAIIYKSFIF